MNFQEWHLTLKNNNNPVFVTFAGYEWFVVGTLPEDTTTPIGGVIKAQVCLAREVGEQIVYKTIIDENELAQLQLI